MTLKIYILILVIIIGIIWAVNVFRITKIAIKNRPVSRVDNTERKKIRKYGFYMILSLIAFFVITFFSYWRKFG